MTATTRDKQLAPVRKLVEQLAEEHDLKGLAAVAEMGLAEIRQLCERPVTCQELDEILERLRGLKLDEFEAGEEL